MKQYRKPVRLSALLLALTIAFSLTALPAAAEGSGRPTVYGEVYAGIDDVGNPTVFVRENPTEQYPDGNKVSLQPGHSYPDEENPLITYSWDDTNRMITAAVNADIETASTGISADADSVSITVTAGNITASTGISADADSGSITVTAGNITASGEESTGVSATGNARITAGTITAGGDYSYGMRVFDGADVTADSVSDADGTGVWARGSGTTVSVRKDIEADRGIELEIQNGLEFGITVGSDVTAKSRGLYVPSEGQPYDPENPGRADVIIGGTLSGQNPIVLGDEIGNDSLNLTVWKIQSGEGGFSGTMRLMPEEGTDEYKLVQDTSGFDATIRYIIRVQQPEKGATLTVKDEAKNELKAIETADGVKIDGVGPLKEGDLLFVVATTEEGYEVTAVYGDEGKKQALEYDETSKSWFMKVPKGGGVVISADVNLKQFTISFFNAEGDQTPLWSGSFSYGETPVYKGETTPTKAADAQFNYTWDGWTPTLVEAVEDASYYAKFAKTVNTYQVSFDTDGGALNASGDESEGGTYDYGTKITLPNATRDGYTLQYWTVGENKYNPNSDFTVSGTQTLTAVWKENETVTETEPETVNSYTVTFNTAGGTLDTSNGASGGGNYAPGDKITLPNATLDGYTLQYWTVGENKYNPNSEFTVSGTQTLTAVWVTETVESPVEDDDKSFLVEPVESFGPPDDWFAGSLSQAHNSVPSSRADDSMSIGRADDSKSISPVSTLPSSQTDDSVPISQADTSRSAGADEIAVYNGYASADVDLASVDMATDISCDNNDDVAIYSPANTPIALKETEKQEIAALMRNGYKIDCGFVLLAKSNGTAACEIKLSEKDVPDGAQIIVNGAAVQAELKDGYFVFDVTLPAIVLVAHK